MYEESIKKYEGDLFRLADMINKYKKVIHGDGAVGSSMDENLSTEGIARI